MKPFVGATVLYFPRDELKPPLAGPASCWAAIVTLVHDREYGPEGEEIGPFVVSLAVFPPPVGPHSVGKTDVEPLDEELLNVARSLWGTSTADLLRVSHAPLAGMYDREDLLKHPEWAGCWNWPPSRVPE